MSDPVDLVNLRSMTDGDAEMEKILFEEFFACFDVAIAEMQGNTGEDKSDAWNKEAHALKGISLNLGAMQLGALCIKAQDECKASADFKADLIKDIKTEYELVRQFLVNLV